MMPTSADYSATEMRILQNLMTGAIAAEEQFPVDELEIFAYGCRD